MPDILFLKHDSSILRWSSNPVRDFSMMEQVRLCAVWLTGALAWLSHEPHTWLHDCLNMLLSCFRKRMSGWCEGSRIIGTLVEIPVVGRGCTCARA